MPMTTAHTPGCGATSVSGRASAVGGGTAVAGGPSKTAGGGATASDAVAPPTAGSSAVESEVVAPSPRGGPTGDATATGVDRCGDADDRQPTAVAASRTAAESQTVERRTSDPPPSA